MLKSLFSGVSGLQSHQIALDVEANNIANVNTIGFKYSRANFSDLLAQTNQIATAPQGSLGGKNAVQVGLGATVASVTRLHSQGSIQNTDKNTDVAIQGDGFFIVSGDGGNTYKYTRSGDFKFDANGNFVDNNGFISQGWTRNETTGLVDATAPIQNIVIPPGLTTPANASTEVVLKANLNSGPTVDQYSPSYEVATNGNITLPDGRVVGDTAGEGPELALLQTQQDFSILFNASGEAFSMQQGEGINISIGGDNVEYIYDPAGTVVAPGIGFETIEDLRAAIATSATTGSNVGSGITVSVNNEGKFQINNGAAGAVSIVVADGTINNTRLTSAFSTLGGTLSVSGQKTTQAINSATHASSIDVYDSLGSKHTVRMEFTKVASTGVGTSWSYTISVPKPGDLNNPTDLGFENVRYGGIINFGENGELLAFNPGSLDFTANNGSSPNQSINLNFGSIDGFDGLTSFDNPSATSGISQDGFPGGDLLGIRIDQSGTLVGSFSNGRSFGLAQIAMAKFTNNEGLTADGGNVYLQSANSGDPIIGQAATAGRGFIQSAALEASNVDLSRSLTQLIIIQRGYQANGKTITTSDQILNTLINLKQ